MSASTYKSAMQQKLDELHDVVVDAMVEAIKKLRLGMTPDDLRRLEERLADRIVVQMKVNVT